MAGGPAPTLQRGHPIDFLVQVLHGNVGSTAEEAKAISRSIGEFHAFLESLHPPPVLTPIAQGQQLGVESQANSQAAKDMNHQVLQPTADKEDVQDTRTVPKENVGASICDDYQRPTNPYSAAQYQHVLGLRQRRLSGTQHGNFANENGAASHWKTCNPDHREYRGRAPDGSTRSTPADPAPDLLGEAFRL
jgi:hypothetical protein